MLVFAFSVQFFFVPEGSQIRPIGWAFTMFVIAAGTAVVVVPTASFAMKKERPRLLGVIGLILGFTPIWFSSFLLQLASSNKGFQLVP